MELLLGGVFRAVEIQQSYRYNDAMYEETYESPVQWVTAHAPVRDLTQNATEHEL